jgi:beta-lactamase regulating signal transducer with metallopeptidase domain
MTAPDLNLIAQISAARIVDCLVGGTLIAIAASVLLRLARGFTSTARFVVWFSSLVAITSLPFLEGAARSSAGASPAAVSHFVLTAPASWALYIFVTWAGIAGFFLVRVGIGVMHLCRLRRGCVPLNEAWIDSELREALRAHGKSRRVALCTSSAVSVPTALGITKPAVVLPVWLIGELSPPDLKQLVLHELAHLRRWDDWTNLAQQIMKALFFFHPAVWWIERRVSLEREMACDDAVLAETANPRAYAECLAHLAEKSAIRRGLALAQAAIGRVRQTSLRVARILQRSRPAGTRYSWATAATVVTGFAAIYGVTVAAAPRVIVFTPDQSAIVAARLAPPPRIDPAGHDAPVAKLPAVHPVLRGSAAPKPHAVETAARWRPTASRHGMNQTAREETAARSHPDFVLPAQWNGISADPVPATQAVYVVIESRQYLPSGVVLCHETVWRFAVIPAISPVTSTPRKQT